VNLADILETWSWLMVLVSSARLYCSHDASSSMHLTLYSPAVCRQFQQECKGRNLPDCKQGTQTGKTPILLLQKAF